MLLSSATVSAFIETAEVVPFCRLLNDSKTCGTKQKTRAISSAETIGSGSVRMRNQSAAVIVSK